MMLHFCGRASAPRCTTEETKLSGRLCGVRLLLPVLEHRARARARLGSSAWLRRYADRVWRLLGHFLSTPNSKDFGLRSAWKGY
jgi:hypothetical protein